MHTITITYDAIPEARTPEYLAYAKAYASANEALNAYHVAIGAPQSAAARKAYINACAIRYDAWLIWQATI